MYLASKSHQRKALLEALDVDFEVVLPAYVELDEKGMLPAQLVEEHSRGKALSVVELIGPLTPERPVLGVDTLVYAGGRAMGKAHDEATAREYLKRMSGQVHVVYSGVTLVSALHEPRDPSGFALRMTEPGYPAGDIGHPERSDGSRLLDDDEGGLRLSGEIEAVGGQRVLVDTRHASTEVLFARLTDAGIDAYLATGEWRERAGAYAIQGRASAFVAEVRGDYTNIVGLPVPLLVEMLGDIGLWPPARWAAR